MNAGYEANCITCLSRLFKAVTLGTGTGSVDTASKKNREVIIDVEMCVTKSMQERYLSNGLQVFQSVMREFF